MWCTNLEVALEQRGVDNLQELNAGPDRAAALHYGHVTHCVAAGVLHQVVAHLRQTGRRRQRSERRGGGQDTGLQTWDYEYI